MKYLKYLKASRLSSMFLMFGYPGIVCFTESNLQLASWIGSEIGLTAPSQVDQSMGERLKYYLLLLQARGSSSHMDPDTIKLNSNIEKRDMLSGSTWGKRNGDLRRMKFLMAPRP